MAESLVTKYFRGQGPVRIALRDANGEPMGLEFIGDLSSLTLTPKVEKEIGYENVSGSSGVGWDFNKRTEYDLSMMMRSFKAEHLAISTHSSNTAKAAGTVTDEAKKGYKGKMTALNHIKVSSVVVTNSAASTTYVAGTDYNVNAAAGLIEIITSGAITDGQSLLVDYSYAAQHHLSASPANKFYYLSFDGVNTADDNKKVRSDIYKINLSPSSVSMIEDKVTEMPITGTVQLDALRSAGDQFFSWKTED